ncbi:cytochrome d ubiquinol oxidase subunit II, partial [Pedobacter jamesrossensis]
FGGIVFIAAERDKIPLADWVFKNTVGLTAIILASLSLVYFGIINQRQNKNIAGVRAVFR